MIHDTTTTTLSGMVPVRRLLIQVAGVLLACLLIAPVASAQAPEWGTNFGFADVTGPDGVVAEAFPDPLGQAFWAGACDLEADSFAVGSDPGVPFAHCIDHSYAAAMPGFPDTGYGPMPPNAVNEAGTAGPPGWGAPPSWRMTPVTQAGAHPDATASFWFTRNKDVTGLFGHASPDGDPKEILVRLPAGVVGNPNALPKCSDGSNLHTVPVTCPPETQIGVSTLKLGSTPSQTVPVYNVEPRDGKTAEFILSAGVGTLGSNVPIVARARTEGDFGVDTMAIQLPAGIPLLGQTITIWGVPWAAEHDKYRAPEGYRGSRFEGTGKLPGMPPTGLVGGLDASGDSQEPQSYQPEWGPIRPFYSNPTECAPTLPETTIHTEMWQRPHTPASAVAPADAPVSGCDEVPFEPDLNLATSSTAADSPTGLTATLSLPQNNEPPFDPPAPGASQAEIDQYVADAVAHWKSPEGRATAQLQDAVVTLPAGVSVNPAGAAGLEGCSNAQMGVTNASSSPMLFNNEDPFDDQGAECPNGSVIGTVAVETPLLDESLTGEVVLGMPESTNPTSGKMFRLFAVVRNRERGLLAKIFGSAVANPATGQLTTTFRQNPRIPFSRMTLEFKGGQRGQLAMPQRCRNDYAWSSLLTPWTAAHGGGGDPVADGGAFAAISNCGFGFAPAFSAGMSNRRGGGSGEFSVSFSRRDGEQWLQGVSAKVPQGLLASVGDVPLCSNAQAKPPGSCPAASRIGTADAGAGSGTPYFLEKKGDVYLTEGYKGAPYGLAVKVPVEAGPFRGQFALTPIVVRQALHVDRTTAQVTAVSDPFPQIWHGIPLRARQVTVKLDRPGFMRNPTDCSAKQITAAITSAQGTVANVAAPFQATGCRSLGFKPRLSMRLSGARKQMRTFGHPGIHATLTQPAGQAAIKATTVRLPRQFALDIDNANGICEYEASLKDEPACPADSVIGRVRAVSPLLSRPLTGRIYFAKNKRVNSFGNLVSTFPALVVALRGEIAVNLRAKTTTIVNRALITEFPNIPDAPVSRFELHIRGGKGGVLLVTQTAKRNFNLCKERPAAEVDMDGHNGKRRDFNARLKLPCKKPKNKKATCKTKKQKRTKACKRRR